MSCTTWCFRVCSLWLSGRGTRLDGNTSGVVQRLRHSSTRTGHTSPMCLDIANSVDSTANVSSTEYLRLVPGNSQFSPTPLCVCSSRQFTSDCRHYKVCRFSLLSHRNVRCRVACCRLVSHDYYVDGTDRQTDIRRDARPLHYDFPCTRPCSVIIRSQVLRGARRLQ